MYVSITHLFVLLENTQNIMTHLNYYFWKGAAPASSAALPDAELDSDLSNHSQLCHLVCLKRNYMDSKAILSNHSKLLTHSNDNNINNQPIRSHNVSKQHLI